MVKHKTSKVRYFKKIMYSKEAGRAQIVEKILNIEHPNILKSEKYFEMGEMYEGKLFYFLLFY
jgi:hypothetical protein